MPRTPAITWLQLLLVGMAVALASCGCYLAYGHRAVRPSLEFAYEDMMALRGNAWYAIQPKLSRIAIGLTAAAFAASVTLTASHRCAFCLAATAICGVAFVAGLLYIFVN